MIERFRLGREFERGGVATARFGRRLLLDVSVPIKVSTVGRSVSAWAREGPSGLVPVPGFNAM